MHERKPAAERRKADLAMIHIAKKEAGLDDQAYRDMLQAVAGVTSSAKLDFEGRHRVIQWFRARGWAPEQAAPKPGRARKPEAGSLASKMLALWLELRRVGKVAPDAGDVALDAFCKRMTGIECREWLTPRQANVVIEGLKQWLAR